MESLASAFDQPIDSPEHRDLAENGWVGGSSVTVRYWLGRQLDRNLFRESNESVIAALQQYFIDRGCQKGARLVADCQAWTPVAILLQHHVELSGDSRPIKNPTKNPRLAAALDAVMADPELTNSQLAALAKTTEKQIARMTDVFVLRRLWKQLMTRPV